MAIRRVSSSWLLLCGAVGIVLAVGGFAWFSMQWRAIQRQIAPGLKSGWIIDVSVPILPRVLCLAGLLLIAFTVLVSLTKCIRARIGGR